MDINENILNAIDTYVKIILKKVNYLYRQTGVIKSKIDDNTYIVNIGDNDFTVNGYNTIYNINDVVEVLIENNSNFKIILYKIGMKL
ncbi:MAG: hypothetical protein ACTTKD_09995 [Peptoanaerobacter stomatis]|uniref:hypothetical protein n=1 Tax=Peptoanaerobacter stomatis TaxID=796937 RepID=UPI003FA03CA9